MKPRILASSLRKTFFDLYCAREYQSFLRSRGFTSKIYRGYNEYLKSKTYTVDIEGRCKHE